VTSPFPFVAGATLTAAQLNDLGDLQTFTPTWNNVTLGASGTAVGKYAQIQNLVFYKASFDLNGTGSITGQINLSLPVGTGDTSTTYHVASQAWVRPTGGTIYHGMCYQSSSALFLYHYNVIGSTNKASSINATGPATWDANGTAHISGWYLTT